jgi:hypothetical protein
MSISFRVMRLLPPRPNVEAGVKLDLLHDTAADEPDGLLKSSELLGDLAPRHARARTHAGNYSDLQAPSDMLALPSSFGSCYLGEVRRGARVCQGPSRRLSRRGGRQRAVPLKPRPAPCRPEPAPPPPPPPRPLQAFRACVVASNVSGACLSRVHIKVELAAERHSTLLFDNSEAAAQELQAGQSVEAVVKQVGRPAAPAAGHSPQQLAGRAAPWPGPKLLLPHPSRPSSSPTARAGPQGPGPAHAHLQRHLHQRPGRPHALFPGVQVCRAGAAHRAHQGGRRSSSAAQRSPLPGTRRSIRPRARHSHMRHVRMRPCLPPAAQVRAAGPLLLLEACVENCLRGPMLLHSARLLPSPGLAARQLQVDTQAAQQEAAAGGDAPRARGPLDQYIAASTLLPANGSCSLLFELTRQEVAGAGAGSG